MWRSGDASVGGEEEFMIQLIIVSARSHLSGDFHPFSEFNKLEKPFHGSLKLLPARTLQSRVDRLPAKILPY
jgi:hypothetical protein